MGYDGIEEFYMIGDNPEGDIVGANNAGWNSVLVRSGIFSEENGHDAHNPTVIMDDVQQSVDWIINKHFEDLKNN